MPPTLTTAARTAGSAGEGSRTSRRLPAAATHRKRWNGGALAQPEAQHGPTCEGPGGSFRTGKATGHQLCAVREGGELLARRFAVQERGDRHGRCRGRKARADARAKGYRPSQLPARRPAGAAEAKANTHGGMTPRRRTGGGRESGAPIRREFRAHAARGKGKGVWQEASGDEPQRATRRRERQRSSGSRELAWGGTSAPYPSDEPTNGRLSRLTR